VAYLFKMTAVPFATAVDSPGGRIGRLAARAALAVCAAMFLTGLVLWARDPGLTSALWLLPDTWSEADLRRVCADLGLPIGIVSAYFMLLELVAATVGLTAAILVLRHATTWFRLYAAAAIALWVTMGGTMPVILSEALDDQATGVRDLLQGLGWVAVFPLAYLFPDGRFVPRWSRWAAVGWAAYLPALGLLVLFGYRSNPDSLGETLPLLVLFGTCVVAAVHRYRRVSTSEQRLQTRGVVAALALWFVVALLTIATPLGSLLEQETGTSLVANGLVLLGSYLVSVLLPASIAVAVLRYRLYEVDIWVNRALVYGALTAMVVLFYALLAGLAGLVWQENELAAPLAATVVIAVALHPLRLRMQRWVNRYVYGRRREPYTVLTDLGKRLETAVPPDQVLRTLAEEVGRTLKLRHVSAASGDVVVSWSAGSPAPSDPVAVFPIRWQDDDLGTLTVTSRAGDDLTDADRNLLNGLARQAGAAVRAAMLNDELRRSRERILIAREDERQRLQRDLHDGLGPTLASLYQRVDAARSLFRTDPTAADELLTDVAAQTRSVIEDIRVLVHALRPPELDELGLAAAVESVGARFDGLRVRVLADDLPPLEPVVESAAYRIAVEALTNAARHSGATVATVRFDVADGALDVIVTDDGRGIAPDARDGTGLRSMRERAGELGGRCDVGSDPDGTTLTATLPLQGPI
jgi:two-component system, NarL family, sensor kinase